MKKYLIIEDEDITANRTINMLLESDENVEIAGPLKSVSEVMSHLAEYNDYDLIFSDIQLTDGLVFDAFRQMKPKSLVIFTTAYDEYAMNAFKANGIDYLMKPLDREELREAIRKAENLTRQEDYTTRMNKLSTDMKCFRERFLVIKGDELIPLKVSEISCFAKEDRHVKACLPDGESFLMQESIAEIETSVNPETFFRINRQYVVNINFVKKISFFFGGKLHLRITGCKDNEVYVSKEKVSKFKDWLNR